MKHEKNIEVYCEKTVNPDRLIAPGYFSVVFVKKGSMTVEIEEKAVKIHKGLLYVTIPLFESPHICWTIDCETVGLKFSYDFLQSVRTLDHIRDKLSHFQYQYRPVWKLNTGEYESLSSLLKKMEDRIYAPDNNIFGKEIFLLNFSEFILQLASIWNRLDEDNRINFNRNEHLVQQFMFLAKQYYKKENKLEFYAAKLFVSAKYLSETVKSITNRTAKEILLEMRMSYAKDLLSNRALSVSEIAYQLSYDSPASFSSYFKQVEGISPKNYREQIFKP